MRSRTSAASASRDAAATSIPMPPNNHSLTPSGAACENDHTSRPRNTAPRAPTASAEKVSPRQASSHAPPTKTALMPATMADRVPRSVRSGLKNVKTMAATANRPAPATASTDCTLSCELVRRVAGGAGVGTSAVVATAAATAGLAAGADAATATGASPKFGSPSMSACRSRSAAATASDVFHTALAWGPARSAPHSVQCPG